MRRQNEVPSPSHQVQVSPKEAAMQQLLKLTGMSYPPEVQGEEEGQEKKENGRKDFGVDITWGAPGNAPPRAALPLTSRIAWVEVLNLDTVGVARCATTKQIFACCPGANEHPTEQGYFASPWVPTLFVKPLVGAVNGAAVHRRTPRNETASVKFERPVEFASLHQKLDLIIGGVQKQMTAYNAAYCRAGSEGTEVLQLGSTSPYCLASTFVGHNASVVEAGTKTKGLGGSKANTLHVGVSIHFNMHVVLRHKTADGSQWTSVHCVAVEESDSGARYLVGSQCSLSVKSAATEESKESSEAKPSASFIVGTGATTIQSRATHMSREPLVANNEAQSRAGGEMAESIRKERSHDDSDPFPFMRPTDQHVETIVDLIQSSEHNHLMPSILRVQVPRCASIIKRQVKPFAPGDRAAPSPPKAEVTAPSSSKSTMTPKQAVMSCRKELQALAAAREAKKNEGH